MQVTADAAETARASDGAPPYRSTMDWMLSMAASFTDFFGNCKHHEAAETRGMTAMQTDAEELALLIGVNDPDPDVPQQLAGRILTAVRG